MIHEYSLMQFYNAFYEGQTFIEIDNEYWSHGMFLYCSQLRCVFLKIINHPCRFSYRAE